MGNGLDATGGSTFRTRVVIGEPLDDRCALEDMTATCDRGGVRGHGFHGDGTESGRGGGVGEHCGD